MSVIDYVHFILGKIWYLFIKTPGNLAHLVPTPKPSTPIHNPCNKLCNSNIGTILLLFHFVKTVFTVYYIKVYKTPVAKEIELLL